jgi:hypothetical protein
LNGELVRGCVLGDIVLCKIEREKKHDMPMEPINDAMKMIDAKNEDENGD